MTELERRSGLELDVSPLPPSPPAEVGGSFSVWTPYHVVGLGSESSQGIFRSGMSQRKLPSFPRQNRSGGNAALESGLILYTVFL